VAGNSGTGLKATLKLAGWSGSAESSAYAITNSTGTTQIDGSENLTFYARTMSVNFTPDTSYTFDETCFTVHGTISLASAAESITQWGNNNLNFSAYGKYNWHLTVSNSCGYPVSGTVDTRIYRSDGSGGTHTYKVNIDSKGQ
jgi:hypothetical protein